MGLDWFEASVSFEASNNLNASSQSLHMSAVFKQLLQDDTSAHSICDRALQKQGMWAQTTPCFSKGHISVLEQNIFVL